MRAIMERLSTERGVFLLVVALLLASTALVVAMGFYDDVWRAFWNLVD